MFTWQFFPSFPKASGCGLSQTSSRAHTTGKAAAVLSPTAARQEQSLRAQAGKQRLGKESHYDPNAGHLHSPARFWFQLSCPKKYIFSIFYNTVFWRRAPECFYRHQNCFEKTRPYVFPVFHVLWDIPSTESLEERFITKMMQKAAQRCCQRRCLF